MPPSLTIGLPVYNGEEHILTSVRSILDQDYGAFELVVSDNGSTDSTPQILSEIADSDSRVQLHRSETNRGASWNFNRVLELAGGSHFRWASHDDFLLPGCLSACMTAITAAEPDNVMAYTKSYITDRSGDRRDEHVADMHLQEDDATARLSRFLRYGGLVNFVFGVWSTSTLRATRGLGSYASSDIVLLSELAIAGKWIEVPEFLFVRRIHGGGSWHAKGQYEGFADWFDTSKRHSIVFPSWRVSRELLRAVDLAAVSSGKKRALRRVVMNDYIIRRRGPLLREVARVPAALVSRVTPRQT